MYEDVLRDKDNILIVRIQLVLRLMLLLLLVANITSEEWQETAKEKQLRPTARKIDDVHPSECAGFMLGIMFYSFLFRIISTHSPLWGADIGKIKMMSKNVWFFVWKFITEGVRSYTSNKKDHYHKKTRMGGGWSRSK